MPASTASCSAPAQARAAPLAIALLAQPPRRHARRGCCSGRRRPSASAARLPGLVTGPRDAIVVAALSGAAVRRGVCAVVVRRQPARRARCRCQVSRAGARPVVARRGRGGRDRVPRVSDALVAQRERRRSDGRRRSGPASRSRWPSPSACCSATWSTVAAFAVISRGAGTAPPRPAMSPRLRPRGGSSLAAALLAFAGAAALLVSRRRADPAARPPAPARRRLERPARAADRHRRLRPRRRSRAGGEPGAFRRCRGLTGTGAVRACRTPTHARSGAGLDDHRDRRSRRRFTAFMGSRRGASPVCRGPSWPVSDRRSAARSAAATDLLRLTRRRSRAAPNGGSRRCGRWPPTPVCARRSSTGGRRGRRVGRDAASS